MLARRFTQRGIGVPTRRRQTSLQKWLQFLEMRWYEQPVYDSAIFSMKVLTSRGPRSVRPMSIDFRKRNPGHCRGSPSNIPVVGWSCAPYAYSTPCTGGSKGKKQKP